MHFKKEALQELLMLLANHPELADRITITIRPDSKPKQGGTRETKSRCLGESPPSLSV